MIVDKPQPSSAPITRWEGVCIAILILSGTALFLHIDKAVEWFVWAL